MAKAKRAAIPESVRRQLASLTHRVSWLEAALRPKKRKTPIDRARAGIDRESAERKTRSDALREFYEQRKIARYREDPNQVKIVLELEQQENAFLRARGLKPNPSDIPKEFRRRLRNSRKAASPN